MSNLAILAEGLGKTYALGEKSTFFDYLRILSGGTSGRKQDNIKVLDGISFKIEQGEIIGIIGRNGAGKSTLLKILSRITSPTEGRAEVYGSLASLLEVGTGFHPDLTGRENIFLNGAILGMRKVDIKRHFDEIVDFAGVDRFVDTPVKRYSSGMYVRLAFSVAAHLQPDILVVDEVLAVGDTDFQKKCLGKMGGIGQAGRTVLFVSHNMAAVRQLTTRCILLSNGRAIYDGDPEKAIDLYSKSVTLAFQQGADLSNWPRHTPVQDRVVTFESLYFEGKKSSFEYKEPITIFSVLKARDAINEIRIQGIVFRGDGVPVGSFFAKSIDQFRAGQEITCKITLSNLQLSPSNYYLRLLVGIGGETRLRLAFDIITEVLPFEVGAVGTEDGTVGNWHPSWGAVRMSDVEMKIVT